MAENSTRKPYPSDLTDKQWAIIEALIPTYHGPGRHREVDLREIVNALIYLNRTGCQWRYLPHDFPDWNCVRYDFDKWTWDGTWQRINDLLREKVRLQVGRDP